MFTILKLLTCPRPQQNSEAKETSLFLSVFGINFWLITHYSLNLYTFIRNNFLGKWSRESNNSETVELLDNSQLLFYLGLFVIAYVFLVGSGLTVAEILPLTSLLNISTHLQFPDSVLTPSSSSNNAFIRFLNSFKGFLPSLMIISKTDFPALPRVKGKIAMKCQHTPKKGISSVLFS